MKTNLLRVILFPLFICVVVFFAVRYVLRKVLLNPWIFIPFGFVAIVLLFYLYGCKLFDVLGSPSFPKNGWSECGVFGDSFGLATSFFTALAFLGTLYAIYLQSKQLEEVRRNYGLEQLPMLAIKELTGVLTFISDPQFGKIVLQIHIRGQEQNLSNTNALNIVRRISMRMPMLSWFANSGSISKPINVLPPHEEKEIGVSIRIANQKLIIEIVRSLKKDADTNKHMQVCVEKMYSNLLGAYGYVKQMYSLEMNNKEQDKLRLWLEKFNQIVNHNDNDLVEKFLKDSKLLIQLTFSPIPFEFIAKPSTEARFIRFIEKKAYNPIDSLLCLYKFTAKNS